MMVQFTLSGAPQVTHAERLFLRPEVGLDQGMLPNLSMGVL